MPNQTAKNGLKAKKTKLPQMNFFSRKTTNKIFIYLLAAFILQIFFKKILELIQSYEDKYHFQDQNGSFVLNKDFLAQTVVITFIYLLALFIVQNLKILTADPQL